MAEKKKFYITTAIAYTSRKPHIGNAYDIVLADMIARYKRMMGFDVYLMTGSDEHGQKIEEYAKAANITPKEYVDKVSGEMRYGTASTPATINSYARPTATMKRLFKKYLKSFMSRAIFTKAVTRGNTAFHANHSSPPLSLQTENARTAVAR